MDRCNMVLNLLDGLEEQRPLSILEFNFRKIVKRRIANLLHYKRIYWKNRCTIRWVKLGGENTKFFHAAATKSYRRNKIPTLTSSDGIAYNDHEAKAGIIWSTFSKRLGSSDKPSMFFTLDNLINRTDGLESLSLPFSTEEIDNIIKMLPIDHAPGPDGLNGLFLKRCWHIIKSDFHALCHGERSVMTYVGELKQLWADLDHLDPLVLAHSECVVAAKKWIEGKRVLKFLKGLNPNFENRRANLLHETQLPSLEAAIAAIGQEETRLKYNEKREYTQRPTYLVSERQETRNCFNCGVNGHLSHQCTAPPRQARGGFRGSRYSRGYYRGGRGRNGGNYYHNSGGPQRGARANMTMEGGQSIVTQNQGSVTEGKVKKGEQQGETSFEQFAHFAYTKGNTENVSLAARTLDSEWVLDSGASKHITGNIGEFELYTQYPSTYHETIQTLPNL
jgi:hypothetical protein